MGNVRVTVNEKQRTIKFKLLVPYQQLSVIGARREFLADANIGRKVYVCINLYNDCPINRGPDHTVLNSH